MKAVILAAGRGSRLESITDNIPKPFVPVNNTPILVNTLKLLEQAGIEEAVIAVGYMKDYFTEKLGHSFGNMSIRYVVNDIWDKTNNSFTLHLCREAVAPTDDILILEADVFFTRSFLDAEKLRDDNNYWFCDPMFFTGSQIFKGDDGFADKIQIIRDESVLRDIKQKHTAYKSSGTVKLRAKTAARMFEALTGFINDEDNRKYYYDVFFNSIIAELRIVPLLVPTASWYEIDTPEDLAEAERTVRFES